MALHVALRRTLRLRDGSRFPLPREGNREPHGLFTTTYRSPASPRSVALSSWSPGNAVRTIAGRAVFDLSARRQGPSGLCGCSSPSSYSSVPGGASMHASTVTRRTTSPKFGLGEVQQLAWHVNSVAEWRTTHRGAEDGRQVFHDQSVAVCRSACHGKCCPNGSIASGICGPPIGCGPDEITAVVVEAGP